MTDWINDTHTVAIMHCSLYSFQTFMWYNSFMFSLFMKRTLILSMVNIIYIIELSGL